MSLIDILDLSTDELYALMDTAKDIIKNPAEYSERCRGKKLATLFYEPSTRTRLSFEAAMLDLGGSVIGFSDAASSSVSKGESVADTARIVSGYADIIAMRHPKEGAPFVAARAASIPVINAGDGGHCHPTQTLADIFTIYRGRGRLTDITVGFCGDLKYGRTVHSLIAALSRYEGIRVVLISPTELSLPDYVKEEYLDKKGIIYSERRSLEGAVSELDVLYMTRIQQERFDSREEYERLKDSYTLTPETLLPAKKDMMILHPLPRLNEISVEVDSDSRAMYFEQAKNGKFMRMALILKLLGDGSEAVGVKCAEAERIVKDRRCGNPRCITSTERGIEHMFKRCGDDANEYRCVYCEART